MARWHLDELENSLNKIGFTIVLRLPPSAKDSFIGAWIIKRGNEYMVDFDGIFDGLGNTIPHPSLDKAIGCSIRDTHLSLYFYKKGKMWNQELKKFIEEINALK
jgi:hypothetical protein